MVDQDMTAETTQDAGPGLLRLGVQRCDPSDKTWLDVTRSIIGRPISDEVADWLLWEATSFPLGTPGEVVRQLHELAAQLEDR